MKMNELNSCMIGSDRVVVKHSDDSEISYGFNGFSAENHYRIRKEDGLFTAYLSADKALEPICITDDLDTAFYASYFHYKNESFVSSRPAIPYSFNAEDDAAFYITPKYDPQYNNAGDEDAFNKAKNYITMAVGLHIDGQYIRLYDFPTKEKASETWNRLTYELEEFNKTFELLVKENRIGRERKSELLRTAFLSYSNILMLKTNGMENSAHVRAFMTGELRFQKYDISRKHYIYSSHMLTAVYNNAEYDMETGSAGICVLHSENALNEDSVLQGDHYVTQVSLYDLTDAMGDALYAWFGGKLYEVIGVYGGFESLRIVTADGRISAEEEKTGFEYDADEDEYCLLIKRTEDVRIYSQRGSVYQILKRNYENICEKTKPEPSAAGSVLEGEATQHR